MHKSRLAGFIVDCEDGNLDEAGSFWGQALGYNVMPVRGQEDDQYRELDTGQEGLQMLLQRVDHASRVHVDIETNDVEAEVKRLETLGAKRIEQVRTWWVMEAPTGHCFCVVRPQRDDFEEAANEWS